MDNQDFNRKVEQAVESVKPISLNSLVPEKKRNPIRIAKLIEIVWRKRKLIISNLKIDHGPYHENDWESNGEHNEGMLNGIFIFHNW